MISIKKMLLPIVLLSLYKCVPPSDDGSGYSTSSNSIDESTLQDCDMYLSFAADNYSRNEFQNAANHFNTVINLGCGEVKADQLFLWLGISYTNIGKLDSADYVFRNGIKYLPSDKDLIEQASYVSGKLNDLDQQIYYLELLIDIDSGSRIRHIEKISKILKNMKRYKEQLRYIDKWLEIDPTSPDAISEKKIVYEKLGRNTIEVDRQRWEKEPQNKQFGLSYISVLSDNGDYIAIIDVCSDLLIYNTSDKDILLQLSKAYENLGKIDEAIRTLKDIYMSDSRDSQIPIDISTLFLSKETYELALEWADKAVKIDTKSGSAYAHRASVYEAIVLGCLDGKEFMNKVVYEMAWEDYSKAYDLGFKSVRAQKNNLEEFITTKSDWFMRPEGEKLISPKGECYNFINRKVKRK